MDVHDCKLDVYEQDCDTGVCVSHGGEVHECYETKNYCPSYFDLIEVNATCSKCKNSICGSGLCL